MPARAYVLGCRVRKDGERACSADADRVEQALENGSGVFLSDFFFTEKAGVYPSSRNGA